MRYLLVILLLLSTPVHAATFVETGVNCGLAYSVRIFQGRLLVTTGCATVDNQGNVIRRGPVDITATLTPGQKLAILNVLSNLDSLGAQVNAIPTPAATPTTIVIPTSTP